MNSMRQSQVSLAFRVTLLLLSYVDDSDFDKKINLYQIGQGQKIYHFFDTKIIYFLPQVDHSSVSREWGPSPRDPRPCKPTKNGRCTGPQAIVWSPSLNKIMDPALDQFNLRNLLGSPVISFQSPTLSALLILTS